jgi:SAM-dependent methyltransferase
VKIKNLKRQNKPISDLDTMYESGRDSEYFLTGYRALKICCSYVNMNKKNSLRILDFPCGYGRVMRWFRNQFPSAEIFGCEIDSRMLDFVEKEFGAKRIQSNDEMDISLPSDLDVIFVGSLLTHFDKHQWDKFFLLCQGALAIDGILVFTTHGRRHALMARDRHPIFGTLVDTSDLYVQYMSSGFSYLPYEPTWPTFGLSLSSPEWVMRKILQFSELKIIHMAEGEWGQDVWVLKRVKEKLA